MKSTKLFLTLTMAMLCIHNSINAQPSFRQAMTAGISTSHPHSGDHLVEGELFGRFVGGEIGVKGECIFPKSLYLSSALSISNKGWNIPVYADNNSQASTWECDVYYLEIPLFVGYKYALTGTSGLFCELGPYLALGLWGHSRLDVDEDVPSNESKNVFKDGWYRRACCGARVNIGLNINQWQWSLGYSYELLKPTKDAWSTIINPQTSSLYLNVAYFF